MLTSIIALLPQLLPIALFFINLFEKDSAQREANKKAFLDALAAHQDDAVAAATERENVWEQDKEMKEKFAKRDAEAAAEAAAAQAKQETQGKPSAP